MPIRMGKGERFYPDFVFGAVSQRGEESAIMVLEAKYRIRTKRELKEAFYQAKSYALRLQSKWLVLCAIDGLWIFSYTDRNFHLDEFITKTWMDMNNPETLLEVAKRIGRREILSS